MVDERNKNGKFKSIIDFMNRVSKEVINKRQLEKLIQAGAFDSIEANRSKLFNNVPKFVELFGGEKISIKICFLKKMRFLLKIKIYLIKIMKNGRIQKSYQMNLM